MVNGVTLLGLHGTFLHFAKMMENDFEFEQNFESDDLLYNFIPGNKIEVEK